MIIIRINWQPESLPYTLFKTWQEIFKCSALKRRFGPLNCPTKVPDWPRHIFDFGMFPCGLNKEVFLLLCKDLSCISKKDNW